MIKFGLFKNYLTPGSNDFKAIVQKLDIIDEEALLKDMIVPGGVTATQASAVLTSYHGAIEKTLKNGQGVRTKFVEIRPAIRGVFDGIFANFDASQQYVVFNVLSRKELNKIAKELNVQKVTVKERVPQLHHFFDSASQRRDEVISTGMVGELKGRFLKCDLNDPNQGVFIIPGEGSAIRNTSFIHNTSTKLIFYISDALKVGDKVELEVRNKLDNRIKELRMSRFPHALTVL